MIRYIVSFWGKMHGKEVRLWKPQQTQAIHSESLLRISNREQNISFRLQERVNTFDPNRIFWRKVIGGSLQASGNYSTAA